MVMRPTHDPFGLRRMGSLVNTADSPAHMVTSFEDGDHFERKMVWQKLPVALLTSNSAERYKN